MFDTHTLPGSGGDRLGLATAGSLSVVLLTVVVGALAYGVLPEPVRIHWTLGMGTYAGPEFAPKAVVVAAFPTIAIGLFASARALASRLEMIPEFEAVRSLYDAAVFAALVSLLVVYVAVILANLV